MKREFLQNFKVGDQSLPKEIIDAILDENGKDIESVKGKQCVHAFHGRRKTTGAGQQSGGYRYKAGDRDQPEQTGD